MVSFGPDVEGPLAKKKKKDECPKGHSEPMGSKVFF